MTSIVRYLDSVGDGTGVKEAIADYSASPAVFRAIAPEGFTLVAKKLLITLQGVWALDANKYGATVVPEHGIEIQVLNAHDDVVYDYTAGHPIKSNAGYARIGRILGEVEPFDSSLHVELDMGDARVTPGMSVAVVVRDNFSYLVQHSFQLQADMICVAPPAIRSPAMYVPVIPPEPGDYNGEINPHRLGAIVHSAVGVYDQTIYQGTATHALGGLVPNEITGTWVDPPPVKSGAVDTTLGGITMEVAGTNVDPILFIGSLDTTLGGITMEATGTFLGVPAGFAGTADHALGGVTMASTGTYVDPPAAAATATHALGGITNTANAVNNDPFTPDVWMGVSYDPGGRTLFDTTTYNTVTVTNQSEFVAALAGLKAGTVDEIWLRPGPAYSWPNTGAITPYDRFALTGYNPKTHPAIIRTEPSWLPVRATLIDTINLNLTLSREGPFHGVAFLDLYLKGMLLLMDGGYANSDVLFENCVFNDSVVLQPYSDFTTELSNCCFRFCYFNAIHWDFSGHINGMYAQNTQIKMEYCTVYHCGWGAGMTRGTLEADGGPTIFKHNLYIQKAPQTQFNNGTSIFRWNVITEASSHGIHMRPGGQLENNLFLKNPFNMAGYAYDTTNGQWYSEGRIADNVFIESDDISVAPAANNPRGTGMALWSVRNMTVEDNVFLYNNTPLLNNYVFELWGNSLAGPENFDSSVVIQNNYSWQWGLPYKESVPGFWGQCTTSGNLLDDGTNFVDPVSAYNNYRADVVIPYIVANDYLFTPAWIQTAISQCKAWMTPV